MMTTPNEYISDLILLSLCGDANAAQQAELQQWISASIDNERYFLAQRELWFSATDVQSLYKYNQEAAYE